jgi:hypothetical protein
MRRGRGGEGGGAGAVGFCGSNAVEGLGVWCRSGEVETALNGGGNPRATTGRPLCNDCTNMWASAHGAPQPHSERLFFPLQSI